MYPLRGGDFAEYSALPWFHWTGGANEYRNAVLRILPRRNGWLPFCRLRDITVQYSVGANTQGTKIEPEIGFEWRRRSSWQLSDEYELSGEPMTTQDVRAILKHRSLYGMMPQHKLQKNPHCESSTIVAPTPTYEPKPLESYLDLENLRDPGKNRFIPMDVEADAFFDDENEISLCVPIGLDECWLWGENYERPDDNPWVDIDILFRVFVMDKTTGMQAKLYESTRTCKLWEPWQSNRFMGFEKSATITQFFRGLSVETIPVPTVRLMLSDAYKDNRYGLRRDDGSFSVSVYSEWSNTSTSQTERGFGAQLNDFDEKDVLTFLEKGLSFK